MLVQEAQKKVQPARLQLLPAAQGCRELQHHMQRLVFGAQMDALGFSVGYLCSEGLVYSSQLLLHGPVGSLLILHSSLHMHVNTDLRVSCTTALHLQQHFDRDACLTSCPTHMNVNAF
jgi:hypothetical protein